MHRKLNFSSKDRHRLPQKIGRHWKAKSKLCFIQCYLNQAEQRPMRLVFLPTHFTDAKREVPQRRATGPPGARQQAAEVAFFPLDSKCPSFPTARPGDGRRKDRIGRLQHSEASACSSLAENPSLPMLLLMLFSC